MTRKEVIKTLESLGFSSEAALIKYYDIRDFLHANRTPVKAITRIKVAPDGDTPYWYDALFRYFPTVHIELGEWYGWLEV